MANKKALITGITGQDGSYLAELLLDNGYEVHGIIRRSSTLNTSRIMNIFEENYVKNQKLFLHYGDMLEVESLMKIISAIKPDEIYNLAAQSHVRVSFDTPTFTSDVSGLGTLRLLETVRLFSPESKVYQASSSEMFGGFDAPQNEDTPFNPQSPYATAKLQSFHNAKNYRTGFNIFVSNGILFNHESPRRGETFVTRKISIGVAKIFLGLQKKIYLGNLDAIRDWGYAPEYVKGMWKMLQLSEPNDYVLSTGVGATVKDFLETSFNVVDLDYRNFVEIDQKFYRPNEVTKLIGDSSKAKKDLGWEAKTKWSKLAETMVEADINRIRKEIG